MVQLKYEPFPWAVLIVGLYIQSNLENILPQTNFGLYQGDGFILLRNLNVQQMDKKRKSIIKIFKEVLVMIFKQILKN